MNPKMVIKAAEIAYAAYLLYKEYQKGKKATRA